MTHDDPQDDEAFKALEKLDELAHAMTEEIVASITDPAARATAMRSLNRQKYFRLDARGNAEPCTLVQWAMFLGGESHVLAQDTIRGVKVSTIFTGLDLSYGGPIPILWETMTFARRRTFAGWQSRCGGSREQAEAMHAEMIERVCTHKDGR